MTGKTPLAKAAASEGKKLKKTHYTDATQTQTLDPYSKAQYESGKAGVFGALSDYNTNSPYKPYTGQMVAGMSGDEQQARQIAQRNVGSQMGALGDAEAAVREGAAFDPTQVEKYMNPFQQEVIDRTLADIERARQMQRVSDSQGATSAGAFGGSRHGVMDSLTNEAALREAGSAAANLRSAGYDRAVDTGFRDVANQYQAAGALSDLASQRQQSWMADSAFMQQLGVGEREIEQAKLDAERAEFDREAADRLQRFQTELQTRMAMMGMTPQLVNTTTNGQQYSQGLDSNDVSNWMSGIGGMMQGIGGMFSMSDRALKRNVAFIGERGGHRWYSWEYVGAPGTTHTGVMAHEVERIAPWAVVTTPSGFRAVNYGAL